jgi:hypothetical protein
MPTLGLGQGGGVAGGRPVSETLELRPQVNRRCFETPLSEALDEAERWASFAHMSCWRPSKGEFSPFLFYGSFPLNGEAG